MFQHARRVTAPDGNVWMVSRRWLHRSPNRRGVFKRRRREGPEDQPSGLRRSQREGVIGSAFEIGLAHPVAFAILGGAFVASGLYFVVVPGVVLLADVILLLLIAGGASVLAVLGVRPWLVEAAFDGRGTWVWAVRGWQTSGRAIEDIVGALAGGAQPEHIPIGESRGPHRAPDD